MATPGQLVKVTADALGISQSTVVQYDRLLAQSGFRSKRGRGTSAAKVTAQDAANLLTAIGASSLFGLSAKDAVEICQRYSALVSCGTVKAKSDVSKLGLEGLARLPDSHSFGDALTTLIECAGQCKFSANDDTSVWVQFFAPTPSARLAVGTKLFANYGDAPSSNGQPRSARPEPGLVHASSVRPSAIRALGAVVANGPQNKPRQG